MKILHIKDKLSQLGVKMEDITLGDYDMISKFTAEKQRSPNDPLFKSVGCFYTPNRERAILICSLMKQYNLKTCLEIGFGRGYTSLCVAKYLHDMGIDGKITSIDPNFDQNQLSLLQKVYPNQWFSKIQLLQGTSVDVVPTLNEKFDLIYVDGDHSYEGTKLDWEMCKDKFSTIMVFDDYHLPSKSDPGIQCAKAINEINEEQESCLEKELIIGDRRIFVDDRQYTDEQIDYGQIVLTKKNAVLIDELW